MSSADSQAERLFARFLSRRDAGEQVSFEDLLREAWLKGTSDGALEQALDKFGQDLERARVEYDAIKQAEGVLDRIAVKRTESS